MCVCAVYARRTGLLPEQTGEQEVDVYGGDRNAQTGEPEGLGAIKYKDGRVFEVNTTAPSGGAPMLLLLSVFLLPFALGPSSRIREKP